MQILSAALAFAITMLILSLVTNVLVETIHRLMGMRPEGLRLMLGHLFDRVIRPMLGQPNTETLAERRAVFLDLMTVNRSPAGASFQSGTGQTVGEPNTGKGFWGLFRRLWGSRRLDGLSVESFMSRLGGSSFSDDIRTLGDGTTETVNTVLADIGQKFIDFGDEASVYFQRRARILAVAVSILVAWFMYVQPFEIFSTFIRDPKVAEAVIAMQGAVTKEFEDGQAKVVADKVKALADAELALEKASADQAQAATDTTSEQGDGTAGANAGATGDQGTLDAGLNAVADEKTDCSVAAGTSEIELLEKDVKEARCELDAALQYAADALHKLQGAGVPIGWDDARMKAAGFHSWDLKVVTVPIPDFSQKGFATAFWLLLGGFLVGLGGPFWYDMVKSLSAIRTVAGSVGAKTDDKAAATGSTMTDGVVQTGTTTLPKTAIEHFNVSAAGRDAADGIGVGEQDDEPPVG